MHKRFLLGLLCVLWVATVNAQAPNVAIESPQSVSLLRGLVTITGTVEVPQLQLYWLQVRALNDTLEPLVEDSSGWLPITLPQATPVINGVLGEWDTTRVEDGIYELQLIAFPTGGTALEATLSPLRVENAKVAYLGGQHFSVSSSTVSGLPTPTAMPTGGVTVATLVPLGGVAPTLAVVAGCNPVATAVVNANVRLGDSTGYSVVGSLSRGEQAPLIGRSTRSAWYVIRLSNGTQGFISPTTVSIIGDVACTPLTEPPALAFTSTPVPAAPSTAPAVVTLAPTGVPTAAPTSAPMLSSVTPAPTLSLPILIPTLNLGGILVPPILPTLARYADLQLADYSITNPPIVCGQRIQVFVRVNNYGAAQSTPTELVLRNYRTSTSVLIAEQIRAIPAIGIGETVEVTFYLEIYPGSGENHLIEFALDPYNLVVESDEANNLNHTIFYFLEANPGVC